MIRVDPENQSEPAFCVWFVVGVRLSRGAVVEDAVEVGTGAWSQGGQWSDQEDCCWDGFEIARMECRKGQGLVCR